MENVTFVEKDQNWQDETTIYWFDVDGESFGVAESGPDATVLDCDGCPVNTQDAKNARLEALKDYVTDELRSEA